MPRATSKRSKKPVSRKSKAKKSNSKKPSNKPVSSTVRSLMRKMLAKVFKLRNIVALKIRKATAAVASAEASNAKLNKIEVKANKYLKKNSAKLGLKKK
jgi:hypothetical protein